uniref:Thioredoxin, mitochondrial n=2 Tax=Canis lupus familiaris TaxID=9615 RepID=A0A8C0Q0Q2_CANLF
IGEASRGGDVGVRRGPPQRRRVRGRRGRSESPGPRGPPRTTATAWPPGQTRAPATPRDRLEASPAGQVTDWAQRSCQGPRQGGCPKPRGRAGASSFLGVFSPQPALRLRNRACLPRNGAGVLGSSSFRRAPRQRGAAQELQRPGHAPSRPFRSWTPPPPPLPDPPLGPARLFRPRPRGPPLFRAPEGPPLLPVLPPANPPPLPFSLPLPHQKPVFRSLTEAPPLPLCRLPPSPLVGNPSHPSSCGEKRSGLPVPGSDVRKALPPEVTKGVPLTGGEGRAVSASLRSGCREMAQRLLLRRFLASVISRKPPQGRWAPLTCRALPCSPGHLTATPTQARSIYTTRVCTTTFNIQDGPDFQDRVVNSETPVVVDFHAQWCGPCKILGPRLEKVVAKQHGKVVMAKVDIDDHTDLALEYEVSAVPTVLAIKNGDVVDKFVGIKDEDQLEAFLKKLIG